VSEITISINGRSYDIACDAGQEGRILDLATYVDQRIREIGRSGAAYNDSHLMVLATLVLANEVMESRGNGEFSIETGDGETDGAQAQTETNGADEETARQLAAAEEALEQLEIEKRQVMAVVKELTARVEGLSAKIEAFG